MLFALGRREALIVGVAVLLTLAATLFASWAWGFTLNRVSLFALIFSIGILVDDAIVVVENIHRRTALDDRRPLAEIIPRAVDEVGGPTILATFTVIAALLPMAFVTGLMGPYMSPIPINASMGMLISLAIAFIVTPWLALQAAGRSATQRAMRAGATAGCTRLFRTRADAVPRSRRTGARNRTSCSAGVIGAPSCSSVSLAVFKLVVLKMLPFDNKSEFQVVVDMPAGTPLEQTARVLREMGAVSADRARGDRLPGLCRHRQRRSTSTAWCASTTCAASPELGDIQVNLVDKHQRDRKSHEIAQRGARRSSRRSRKQHGAKVKVVEVPPGPPVLSPIVAEVYGPDYDGQIAVAKQVRAAFAATAGHRRHRRHGRGRRAAARAARAAEQGGAARAWRRRDVVETMRMGLSGEDVTPLHNGAVQVRDPGAPHAAAGAPERARRAAQAHACARRDGHAGAAVRAGRGDAERRARRPSTTRTCCRWST